MSDQTKNKSCQSCNSCVKGTTALVLGSALLIYGLVRWFAQNEICLACIIGAPFFLALGIYLRYIYLNKLKTGQCDISKPQE